MRCPLNVLGPLFQNFREVRMSNLAKARDHLASGPRVNPTMELKEEEFLLQALEPYFSEPWMDGIIKRHNSITAVCRYCHERNYPEWFFLGHSERSRENILCPLMNYAKKMVFLLLNTFLKDMLL